MKTILKKAKRTLSLLLVLLMVVPMMASLAVPASAAETVKYEVEGGYIEFNTSTGTITNCDDTVTKADIPAQINGVEVTSIGYEAFSRCTLLKSITIPDSVTSISERAFYYSTSLESITIPDGVTSIGDEAFSECTSLKSITIPDSVTSIGDEAFVACSSLESITIPDSVTSIGERAFSVCRSLESITIPDGVTSIGGNAFSYCSSLESITIPDSVTSIGRNAFYSCTYLESITIPDSVTSIGDEAFSYCSSLKSITIPDGVTSIEEGTFSYCEYLESITIPDSVTSIGVEAFSWCKYLESITIPDGVASIGERAFFYCSSLESITIPDSVTSIGVGAFSGCHSLESITIPDSVTSIGDFAFSGCHSLESITIPDGVTEIREGAFEGCGSLKSITIPKSVTKIKPKAFADISYNSIIYYKGTQEEWNQISIKKDAIRPETIIIYYPCSVNGHTFGDWTVTVEPTEYKVGEKTRECEICRFVETAVVDKLVPMTNPFTDVKDGQWYTEGILWCYQNGYMAGISDTDFGRKQNVTRAMFVTILAKIDGVDLTAYEGKTSFSDVSVGKWYSSAIEWAYQNGLTSGLAEGYFGYKSDITREQLATFFYTYSEKKGYDVTGRADLSGFADLDRVHSWALDAMAWAVDAGLISGTSPTTLAPRVSATRAELALIVKNYVETVKSRP